MVLRREPGWGKASDGILGTAEDEPHLTVQTRGAATSRRGQRTVGTQHVFLSPPLGLGGLTLGKVATALLPLPFTSLLFEFQEHGIT